MNDNGIETVRARVDIVELIGEQVRLQKAGRAFKGLCPFHNEKTPSFQVNPERQTWHCFGSCSAGGDIFTYVMKRDNVDFGEALRGLAERAGVSLASGPPAEQREAHERLFAANEAAIAFFQQALSGSAAGGEARAYVARRGFDEATLADFELGFAPEGWEHLRTYLHGKGFADAELLAAGLLSENENGGVYDRFRKRLMFPIRDERGRAVAFGGRALDDARPKYLNSPQTPLFDKGSLLYALPRAREAIRTAGEAVIVEGYVDAITAHQFGYKNVVATLGTALTERHIQLLRRLTRRVTLAMDADTAGIEAALRGEEVARTASADGERSADVVTWDGLVRAQARAPVDVRVFTVPSGKDPDDAIRETPDGWPAWVQQAIPPFEFRLRLESGRIDMTSPRARVELADRMLPLLLQIGDPALQAAYLSRLAGIAAVPETALAARLRGLTSSAARGVRPSMREKAAAQRVMPELEEPPAEAGPAAPAPRPEDKVETFALALLLRYPELRAMHAGVDPDLFQIAAHRQLFLAWREAAARDRALSAEDVPAVLHPLQTALLERDLAAYAGGVAQPAVEDALRKLHRRLLGEQKRLLTAELRELQQSADQQAALGLVLTVQGGSDAAAFAEASEPVITLSNHLRDDEYLFREIHALEWETRTRQRPSWTAADEVDRSAESAAGGGA